MMTESADSFLEPQEAGATCRESRTDSLRARRAATFLAGTIARPRRSSQAAAAVPRGCLTGSAPGPSRRPLALTYLVAVFGHSESLGSRLPR